MSEQKNFEFKTEVKQLLHLLAFSLYKNKEIFLRELISNASDALSKLRYLKLTSQEEIADRDIDLEIEIVIDKKDKILKVIDTGIGMTEEEIINNIGTIAKSGTLEFLKKIGDENKKNIDAIGQFGVGFYSSFIVAKKVCVISKSYKPDAKPVEWESDGSGTYSIKESEKKKRGTEVILYLKDGEEEFLEKYRVESIIQKYSNFISYPILIEKGQVNKVEALWLKPKSAITEEDYKEFFKFIAHSSDEPLFYEHLVADAPFQYRALLFCPKTTFEMLGFQNPDYGLALYSNKVMIMQECKDLIPKFLRFIKGIVDSEDIPLNISRETIQNNTAVIKIKQLITKNIITTLENMMKNNKEKYLEFYKNFKNYLKEGVLEDWENKSKIAALLLFNSSKCKEKDELVSLNEYIIRMMPGQNEIYYLYGLDRNTIENSPYIEIFQSKNIEVLYLSEPIDEIVLTNLAEFENKKFKNIEQANIDSLKDIVSDTPNKEQEKIDEEIQSKVSKLIKFMKDLLKDKVKDVVESQRLVGSAGVLVQPDEGMSSQVEKIMKMMHKDFTSSKKILEINPKNLLIKNIAELYAKEKDSDLVKNLCFQLYDNLILLEGTVEEPSNIIKRINFIMEELTKTKL